MKEKIKNYINIKSLIILAIIYLLFYFSSYLQLIPIIIFDIDLHSITDSLQVLLSLFSNIIVAMILILIFKKQLKVEFKKFISKLEWNIDCGIKYWLIGLGIMLLSNILIGLLTSSTGANNEKAVQSMITALPWIMVINAGIIAPIVEELVFRTSFKNAFPNKKLFIILSGLIFGALHITNATSFIDYLYIIPYSSLGIAFAAMYVKTDTVFTPISMHMFHNIVLTVLSIIL